MTEAGNSGPRRKRLPPRSPIAKDISIALTTRETGELCQASAAAEWRQTAFDVFFGCRRRLLEAKRLFKQV